MTSAFKFSLQNWRIPRLVRATLLACATTPANARWGKCARVVVRAAACLARTARLELLAGGATHLRETRLHEGIRVGRIGKDERHGVTLGPFLYSKFVKAFYMPTVQDSDFLRLRAEQVFLRARAQPAEARCTRPLGGARALSGQEEVVRRRHGHQAYLKTPECAAFRESYSASNGQQRESIGLSNNTCTHAVVSTRARRDSQAPNPDSI